MKSWQISVTHPAAWSCRVWVAGSVLPDIFLIHLFIYLFENPSLFEDQTWWKCDPGRGSHEEDLAPARPANGGHTVAGFWTAEDSQASQVNN